MKKRTVVFLVLLAMLCGSALTLALTGSSIANQWALGKSVFASAMRRLEAG